MLQITTLLYSKKKQGSLKLQFTNQILSFACLQL